MYKRCATGIVVAMAVVLFLGMTGQTVKRVDPLVPPATPGGGQMVDETPALWFVELASPPLEDGGAASSVANEKAAFRAAAGKAGIRFIERFAFDRLWNGLSIQIESRDLARLGKVKGVRALYPVIDIPIPRTAPGEETDLATALAMTGADVAQNELGFTGKGIRVGIIDTGIDYHHPDLGGGFGPGYRVYTGYDFVGKIFNADPASASYNPYPNPDPDPDDEAGHGTHVSGIVGANGVVKGVAPEVRFGAYKVFGAEGSTTADVMIAAMERALADRMQVVNMSIGASYQWPQYPTALATDRLVNRGVVVVCSIGNNGAYGLYSAGAPGVGKKAIGVASFDNAYEHLAVFNVGPDGTPVSYTTATACPPAPVSGTYEMARTGTTSTTNDACDALPAGSLTGKVALIRRGTCSFYIKAANAMNAGAAAVVLYNNTTGRVSPNVAGTPAITIPVVAITAADGALIDGRIAAGADEHDMDGRFRGLPLIDGRAHLVVQLLRTFARSRPQARPGSPGRQYPLHLSSGARKIRDDVGDVHVHAPRHGSGGPSPSGEARDSAREGANAPAEQRQAQALVGQSRDWDSLTPFTARAPASSTFRAASWPRRSSNRATSRSARAGPGNSSSRSPTRASSPSRTISPTRTRSRPAVS